MRLGKIVLAVSLTAAGGLTLGQNLSYRHDPAFRFPRNATYDSKSEGLALPLETVEYMTDHAVKNTLDRLLESRGYRRQTQGRADFLIKYYIGLKKPPDARDLDYGVPSSMISSVFGDTFPTSTLVVDIIDGTTNQLAWRGTADEALSTPLNQRLLERSLDAMVERFQQDTLREE